MSLAAPSPLSRRLFLGALCLTPLAGRASAAALPVITVLGDSITAGYGLHEGEAVPAQLKASLARLGAPAQVRAAGVSGDTSAGGLARVDFSVQPDTALCIVALGGNDLLQGLDPRSTRANLQAIVRRLKARRIRVLLCGLRAPPLLNAGFAREFNAVFPAVARDEGVALYPDLLAGVAMSRALNQRDGIHPNAAGVKVIVGRLAPFAVRALRARA